MNETSLSKFQDLLRTLFQFDCADLDFGIYRILNYKRRQVEAFITERLPQIVDEAFAQYATAERATLEQELAQLRKRIEETERELGQALFDETGRLKETFQGGNLGKRYLEVLGNLKSIQVADELKTRVYNDLYTFFSRYYEDGDFISKRRYGRQTYAIPYNGEEVVLYWANRDQYYVKTGNRFKAYRFNAGEYTVAFELRNIAPGQSGNGGKKRYFVLAHDEAPVGLNEQEKVLSIAFEYRPLTEAEEKEHGRTEQQKPQDSLNEAAEKKILGRVADASLKVALARPEGANGRSLLLKHLTRFTRKNTADFFVHKDLRGFLRREVDFFIKNEVLLLDELIAGGEEDLRQHVQRGRVVRQVAEAIIDFLAQVEDFQKKLWEKKKFVVRTEYCLTLDRLPEELWDEVLANEAQVAEWRQLYSIDGKMTKNFLKAHPTLVVDTRHFSEDFKWRLLSHFDDLDDALDGLLIKSENWQALNLLLERCQKKVKCIYIDPPYNSKSTEILYPNFYKHSSWLSLIQNRLTVSRFFSTPDGSHVIAIDENEQERLGILLSAIFPNHLRVCVAVVHNKKGIQGDYFSYTHEYAYFCIPPALPEANERPIPQSKWEYDNLRKWGKESERHTAKNCFYPIFVKNSEIVGFGEVCPDTFHPSNSNRRRKDGVVEVYPVDSEGIERKWRYARDSIEQIRHLLKVHLTNTGEIQIHKAKSSAQYKTVWDDPKYIAGDYGTRLLTEMGIFPAEELYPKSIHTVSDSIHAISDQKSVILDYFAGSGTTAHAVINLNGQDGGKRKYILVEIGDWFETVILPRIKKVVFCEKWKDGKSEGGNGASHFLKYHYLEQYEDTLNNLELPRAEEGQLAFEKFGDEYLLKYMLDFETQGSPCLLNLDMFKDPFAYRLKILEGDEVMDRPVDLVETFSHLLGIQVRKMRILQDNGRPYRVVLGEKNSKRVAVVWRPVAGLEDNEEVLMKDRIFIEQTVLPSLLGEEKPERLLVNGAYLVKEAEAIEPEFKRLMFATVN